MNYMQVFFRSRKLFVWTRSEDIIDLVECGYFVTSTDWWVNVIEIILFLVCWQAKPWRCRVTLWSRLLFLSEYCLAKLFGYWWYLHCHLKFSTAASINWDFFSFALPCHDLPYHFFWRTTRFLIHMCIKLYCSASTLWLYHFKPCFPFCITMCHKICIG